MGVFEIYGFVPSFANETILICLLCEVTFSNDAMNPAKMRDHLQRIHSDKRSKDLEYFNMPMQKLRAQPNLNVFFKSSVGVDSERELMTSCRISLNMA